MSGLERLPRRWWTIGIPGIAEREFATYWTVDLDAMPPVPATLDGRLGWLLDNPIRDSSLERGRYDATQRDANRTELDRIAPGLDASPAFLRFVTDPEPRRHLRSATLCHLDLGHFAVQTTDGGRLVHFLSDQQWALHWLLSVGPDGAEAVVASPLALGFDEGDGEPMRRLDLATAGESVAVCSDSFEEFRYRFWMDTELFFRLAVDGSSIDELPAVLRNYARLYPRDGE